MPARNSKSNLARRSVPGFEPVESSAQATSSTNKKKKHRAGRKKKAKGMSIPEGEEDTQQRPPMYRLGQSHSNLSDTSLASDALLDHRQQSSLRIRRESRAAPASVLSSSYRNRDTDYRTAHGNPFMGDDGEHHRIHHRRRKTRTRESDDERDSDSESANEHHQEADDRTPLLATTTLPVGSSHGTMYTARRSESKHSSLSARSKRKKPHEMEFPAISPDYDVNNPPSMPTSPQLEAAENANDPLIAGSFSPTARKANGQTPNDFLVDIGEPYEAIEEGSPSRPDINERKGSTNRRKSIAFPAEGDVCFPHEALTDIDPDEQTESRTHAPGSTRRRRFRQWPDLDELEEWSREERKEMEAEEEHRSQVLRAKKISEPILVGGRLRPTKHAAFHHEEEEAPYRFTYFNEEFDKTIHSQTISELVQEGTSFRELFIPDPPELSDISSGEEDDEVSQHTTRRNEFSPADGSQAPTRTGSAMGFNRAASTVMSSAGDETVGQLGNGTNYEGQGTSGKKKRYGARPTFWLDVLSPTEAEMRVLSKAFGIHPLTAEDIMMQEAREKVELFRNYYFVAYRTFEQDQSSEDYLEPVNLYVVVFRDGVISFHFSMTPHPANVRRRIRQLKDYLILSADWISYAIIDDITDAFAPLIQSIEDEVDEIDDAVLEHHSSSPEPAVHEKQHHKTIYAERYEKVPQHDPDEKKKSSQKISGDMLRSVGQCRKKVMGLYRLLGNKADVIKGFAKRCNEQWEVAPRSEIGLYLGDIQDHILTMTSNLSHYETLLSRAHSNYLAQINIRMNERSEETADVLGKLTVLGTIVLPMNIITGMWGMNVLVPGQDTEELYWFWGITACLFGFGIMCFFIAKRVYGIV